MKEVLLAGYGSIGKRHASNLIVLGIKPYVLTSFPDGNHNITFIKNVKEIKNNIEYTIIGTPTANHFNDLKKIASHTGCKKFLIEKPVEASAKKAEELRLYAKKNKINLSIAYNMRFLNVFDIIRATVEDKRKDIRKIEIFVGQYLPEWRPYKPYTTSYSSKKNMGGGVELDLSHEFDYTIWLFGLPQKKLFIHKNKISTLKINSNDFYKGIFQYKNFILDIELDYFRKKNREMNIIGENENILNVNFIKQEITVNDKPIKNKNLFNWEESYLLELKEFLGHNDSKKLCPLADGLKVYSFL